MSIGDVTTILRQGVLQVLMIAGPMLISALVVGLVVAILQASTSIQEQTLTFVPKVFAILGVLAIFGGLMMTSLRQYTINLFRLIPEIIR
jgi:flagellar biosynthetic protein FliQ